MSLGFVKCSQEQVVYTRNHGEEVLIVGVYVDDLIVTRSSIKNVDEFKKKMMKELKMSDLGLLSYYFEKVLKQFAMEDCNSSKYHMEAKLQLRKNVKGSLVDPKEYRRIIVCLRYLTHTRPDISNAVGIVS
ncbi:uncharacterized mitochondrial protein AtMg00810-like [Impatiens glandulifera]|uniref:uncharacterized mitochondrial protein AtMg00810-like n=1 Tax=Impatiens glandulifera TaxID=253017 RepID=UPI001FB09506|nr:uncharacterized mitochondrial protein AtMg00810-like [Impatiens glandulifera]